MRGRLATAVATAVVVVGAPAAAFADAARPSDFRSEIVSVLPATDALTATIEGGDSFVRIEVAHGHDVKVEGYAGEPYLRHMVLAAVDPQSSWERFLLALNSDIGDVQGGTTKEGIHLGVMAGTLDLLQRGYMGAGVRDGVLHIEPRRQTKLDRLTRDRERARDERL